MIDNKLFLKNLTRVVLPIAFQLFMLSLVSASDALMLGMLSQDALSAVSLASQVTFVENLFLAALTIGLSTLAAQFWGKKQPDMIETVFAYTLKVTSIIALMFFLLALIAPSLLMRFFTNDQSLILQGASYLRVVSPSFLLTGISQIYLCILKNTNRAFKASLISSACVVINIALNAVFIFGLLGFPALAIAGAALATDIARIIELICCLNETGKKSPVRLKMEYIFKEQTDISKDFWKYTGPVLGNEIVWGMGFTMYSVIMGHLGTDAVAANSIANIVKNLVVCFCTGLGSGGGILVGNELGAGHLDLAKEYGKKLCHLSIICGLISGFVMFCLTPAVLYVTSLSQTSQHYLQWMFFFCAIYMVGKSINGTTIAGIFCAGGDTRFGFICDTITMWCITVPLGLISAFILKWPVLVTYLIINMDEIVKLPAVYCHYKKYLWVKDLTNKQMED